MSFLPRMRRALRIDRPDPKRHAAREVDDELAFHLESRVRDLVAQEGLSEEEAGARALAEFGDVERAGRELRRETRRAERGLRVGAMLDRVVRDMRFGARRLRRRPLFTVAAAVTLALGIGATTAIFSVIDGVLLRPLPYTDSERIVALWHASPGIGVERTNISTGTFFNYLEENRTLEDLALWDNVQVTVTGLDEPERLDGLLVTSRFLPLFGVRPAAGRFFTAADDAPGAPATVIISHAYWQSRFGGDPGVVGRTLVVNGGPIEILGVLPSTFRFPGYETAVLFPFRLDRSEATVGRFNYQALARLRPEATIEQAHADLASVLPRAVEKFGGWEMERLEETGLTPLVVPFKTDIVGHVGGALWLVFIAVGILLAIAIANVANLFLVRAEGRNREVALRTALGAGFGVTARELLLEGVVLGVVASALGWALAYGALELLHAVGAREMPRVDEIALDGRSLAFTLGVTLVSVLGFSLLPLLRYARSDLQLALRGGDRGLAAGRSRSRSGLAAGQLALALVLLIGAGLMVRSFGALTDVDPGFERPEEVVTFRLFVPTAEVPGLANAVETHRRIVEGIGGIRGVAEAAVTNSVPMDGRNNNNGVLVADFPLAEGDAAPSRRHKFVSPGYFRTMGNRVLAGRTFTWDDAFRRRTVAVVTADFASEYWDSPSDAIGKRILENSTGPWKEIVGVVEPVHDDGVERGAVPTIYWPLLVADFWGMEEFGFRSVVYAVRSSGPPPTSLLPRIREAVWGVNANLPLANIQTLASIEARSRARTSFTSALLVVAAAIALLLGIVGLYGVVAYTVSVRRREIGVRMALGARRLDVTSMVVRQGLALAGVGVLGGLAVAAALTRLMRPLLFEIDPVDPWTYAATAAALALVAVLASYLPGRRAASVDPVRVLREE